MTFLHKLCSDDLTFGNQIHHQSQCSDDLTFGDQIHHQSQCSDDLTFGNQIHHQSQCSSVVDQQLNVSTLHKFSTWRNKCCNVAKVLAN